MGCPEASLYITLEEQDSPLKHETRSSNSYFSDKMQARNGRAYTNSISLRCMYIKLGASTSTRTVVVG
jgi:hypothetical protein